MLNFKGTFKWRRTQESVDGRCQVNAKGFFMPSKKNAVLSCSIPEVLVSPFLVSAYIRMVLQGGNGRGSKEKYFVLPMFYKSNLERNLSSLTLFLCLQFHSSCIVPKTTQFFTANQLDSYKQDFYFIHH